VTSCVVERVANSTKPCAIRLLFASFVAFISAHCTDACPLVNAQFSDAATQIAHQRLSTRLLTITLDPAHDPPSLMRSLATRFGANPRYWLLASGHRDDVDAILSAYGVLARGK
jgi:cytochrome oxidase Cu insertion factor (SCO1/SenC/PrrC family)